jgi:hypothetical protein
MREGADTWEPFYYDADGLSKTDVEEFREWGFKRRPSIHMPKWVCRCRLRVLSVRPERLQEITEEDAKAEGVRYFTPTIDVDPIPRQQVAFRYLWESIHGPGAWDVNPWVWRYEFEAVK